ncbi:glycoside hydrolase family 15 protein [Geotalea sp. SG265]|uniref:glycoside hydrolase family 15 protein n=1 Tax=Geotalea sp. SG265 TaxID=2922867 RepID=UPI001FAF9DC3|nr:glycoside hydrolase family 15 protein [Geotalea sp. SG265]
MKRRKRNDGDDRYPPIADYGFLSDCHSSALVSRDGSIDWCCMPRLDSGSIFGRILDWENGGYCRIAPAAYRVERRYLPGTLVLETRFLTEGGEATVTDCFPMCRGGRSKPYQQILRLIEGCSGEVTFAIEVLPRFHLGSILPWIVEKDGYFAAFGGSNGLHISGDISLKIRNRHDLVGSITVGAGQRYHLSIMFRRPEVLDGERIAPPTVGELDRRLVETITWWRDWSARGRTVSSGGELVQRSAIVLKGLSNAPTGAIAAAATTSLPESIGGIRNWDYRCTWVRDSVFSIRSLAELGHLKEADGFRRFVERSAAGSADELQVLFGVGGERLLHERDLHGVAGYRASRPVRIGNAAAYQKQHDMYGELLDSAWRWHLSGQSPDDDYWQFLLQIADRAVRNWHKPDRGIWEVRGESQHFVHSKVMCWLAVDRAISLARDLERPAPVPAWEKARDRIRNDVMTHGYDRRRGVFIRAYGSHAMDAALLLLPMAGFVAYDDPIMVRTVDAVCAELGEDGLLLRYPRGIDRLPGLEGIFMPCSFWLAECLARQGRLDEARLAFARAAAAGNDLGLFSEEYDVAAGEMLGNFPQGLTHLSLIMAAVALEDMEGKEG